MRSLLLSLVFPFALCLTVAQAASEPKANDDFRRKLSDMLQRAEKSEKLLRQQITESQTAPFLPDLYLQLAQLLSEKSNTLYYIQMEKQKGSSATASEKELSPVIAAQKEAIAVYKVLLKDFPAFDKKKETLYRLALGYKSIEENGEFMKIAGQILKEYPATEEAMGSRLLLGQTWFEGGNYKGAHEVLLPITTSKFAYERNLARYRIGLIFIAQEKFREALTQFESVVRDNDLKEQDNPYNVSLKTKKVKSDLKREALIDSIRAYTRVFEKSPEPVTYYSALAPTETHFQEVIEKLSLRYIHLKKYDSAIKLLRTLSERTPEPQKVINIYQEVLLMIPLKDRVYIPVEEMRFLLEKYNLWTAYYTIPKATQDQSYLFLEKQTRELGTTAHSWAKAEKTPERRVAYFKRARDFYHLYLASFRKTKDSAKMATNLADVNFALNDFQQSGDYYLRTFAGEFGPPAEKKLLIENAILCLQKKGKYSFYESIRMRGLLIRAIEAYMQHDKKMAKDPNLNFLLVKTSYEQGFFPEVLDQLLAFMKAFPKDSRAVDAGELILDYYNTRNDYAQLQIWSSKILKLKLANRAFNDKVSRISQQAKSKLVHEKVRSLAGYDGFSEGKNYLTVALASENVALKNLALKEALAKSKTERDIQTFLKVASIMSEKEKDPYKKAEILRSVAKEHIKVTQYYRGLGVLTSVHNNLKLGAKAQLEALEEALTTAMLLRDWRAVMQTMKNPLFKNISVSAKTRLREQISELLDSPIKTPVPVVHYLMATGVTDESLLSLYKARYKIDPASRARTLKEVEKKCTGDSRSAVCLWRQAERLEVSRQKFLLALKGKPGALEAIQKFASEMMTLNNGYRGMENSKDPHLETVVALRTSDIYTAFGQYLRRAADANGELKAVLLQKAEETMASAKMYRDKCKLIADKTSSLNPAVKPCLAGQSPQLKDLLHWDFAKVEKFETKDPESEKIEDYQKIIFSGSKESGDSMLALAKEYLNQQKYHHATATAAYGISLHRSQEREFRTVFGCSVMNLGYFSEANYHFKNAEETEGLLEKCQKQLNETFTPSRT